MSGLLDRGRRVYGAAWPNIVTGWTAGFGVERARARPLLTASDQVFSYRASA
jgi:hypothetical protein